MRGLLLPKLETVKSQALVEFALIVPLLLLVLMGIFDLGWAVYAKNTITDAAREGARAGIVLSATDAQISARVHAAAPSLANLQVTIDPPVIRTFNQPITVTIVYTYVPVTPLIGQIVTGSGLRLQGSSSMIVEGVIPY